MMNCRYRILILIPIMLAVQTRAAEFCANSSAVLQAVLDIAETNGQDDLIKIAAGSYVIPNGNGFRFDQVFTNNADNMSIEIVGGWTPFFNNPCGQLLSPSPYDTVLDGNNLDRVLRLLPAGNADVTIRNILFLNGETTDRGGGLYILGDENHLGDIRIENNAFIANEANFSGALSVSRGSTIRVINNLVVANHSSSSSNVSVVNNDANGLYVVNNTIVLNTSGGTNLSVGGLHTAVNGSSQAFIANNILWNNDFFDLRVIDNSDGDTYVYNNDIEDQNGFGSVQLNNLSVDPQFASGILNFGLDFGSPLRDAGRMPPFIFIPPVPFQNFWTLPDGDLLAQQRVQGVRVDIGAFEALPDAIFDDGFED